MSTTTHTIEATVLHVAPSGKRTKWGVTVDGYTLADTYPTKAKALASGEAYAAGLDVLVEANDLANEGRPAEVAPAPENPTMEDEARLNDDQLRTWAGTAEPEADAEVADALAQLPSMEQIEAAAQQAAAERAEREAAKAKAKPAPKPKHAASDVGSDAWKALRDRVLAVYAKAAPKAAVQLCLAAKAEGMAWQALDVITRDAAVRGLNAKVWAAWQAGKAARKEAATA